MKEVPAHDDHIELLSGDFVPTQLYEVVMSELHRWRRREDIIDFLAKKARYDRFTLKNPYHEENMERSGFLVICSDSSASRRKYKMPRDVALIVQNATSISGERAVLRGCAAKESIQHVQDAIRAENRQLLAEREQLLAAARRGLFGRIKAALGW